MIVGTGCPRSGLQVSRLGRYTPFNLSSQSLQGCVVPRVWLDSDPKAESGPQGWLRDHSPAMWKELCQAEPAQRERAASWQTRQPRNSPHTLRMCCVLNERGSYCKSHTSYRDSQRIHLAKVKLDPCLLLTSNQNKSQMD